MEGNVPDAVEESSDQEHGNLHRSALNDGRDEAEDTDYLDAHFSADFVRQPGREHAADHSAAGEEAICCC